MTSTTKKGVYVDLTVEDTTTLSGEVKVPNGPLTLGDASNEQWTRLNVYGSSTVYGELTIQAGDRQHPGGLDVQGSAIFSGTLTVSKSGELSLGGTKVKKFTTALGGTDDALPTDKAVKTYIDAEARKLRIDLDALRADVTSSLATKQELTTLRAEVTSSLATKQELATLRADATSDLAKKAAVNGSLDQDFQVKALTVKGSLAVTAPAEIKIVSPNNGGKSATLPAPERVLSMVREGVPGESWPNVVNFNLGRYQNDSRTSRTQLNVVLGDGDLDRGGYRTVMTMLSNGNVGIGTTDPQSGLHISRPGSGRQGLRIDHYDKDGKPTGLYLFIGFEEGGAVVFYRGNTRTGQFGSGWFMGSNGEIRRNAVPDV